LYYLNINITRSIEILTRSKLNPRENAAIRQIKITLMFLLLKSIDLTLIKLALRIS